eukprot:3447681-Pyramimonas_sp.AAC.1
MYSRVHLGRDVADVDPLHFFVQSLIAATNFMIILAFRNEIRRKKQESRTKAQVQGAATGPMAGYVPVEGPVSYTHLTLPTILLV